MTNHTHYWFAPPGDKLGYGDGRIAKVGETHTVEGSLKLCGYGLHMCKGPIDALEYAHSAILFGVSPGEEILEDDDPIFSDLICSRSRTYHWRLDCSDILAEFARFYSLEVARNDIVRRLLESHYEELRKEGYSSVAVSAGRADADAAIIEGARFAAARAAYDVAGADPDAYDYNRSEQNAKLEKMIMEKLADTRSKGIGR